MRNKKFSFLIFCLFFVFNLVGQDNVSSLVEKDFPASWQGDWAGELQIFNAKGLQQCLPMQLIIQPIKDSEDYSFTIIYGVDVEAGTRSYLLKTINAEKGHYLIDEQNSIKIDAYLLGEKLVQRFEVMGNLLETFIEKRDDTLVWEIFSGKMKGEITGDTVLNGDTIPPVQTFPMSVFQKCILTRI